MKKIFPALIFSVAVLCLGNLAVAQSTPNSIAPQAVKSSSLTPEERDQATFEKHTKPVMDALKLDDAAKAAKVHDIMIAQFAAWKTWHDKNDAQIKELWSQFNKARSAQNETNADNALAQIDAVYATFKPQHDEFVAKLDTVLTSAQIETVEDALTINKVKITYHAYGEIFRGLTDEQNAFILKELKAAREEAIDAGQMTEKSAFFKKYKIQIEAYLTAQGYDVKQSYKDFVAKQKSDMAAKKAADETDTKPADSEKK
jgi:hypothetical protein